jgi:hypothetical protein
MIPVIVLILIAFLFSIVSLKGKRKKKPVKVWIKCPKCTNGVIFYGKPTAIALTCQCCNGFGGNWEYN